MNHRPIVTAKRLLVMAVAALMTAPLSVASAPAETVEEESVLYDIAGFLNSESLFISTAVGSTIECGEGCGQCSAGCAEGETGTCTCEASGECGSWPFKKAAYKCTCTCSKPPEPEPPTRICIEPTEICITTEPFEIEGVEVPDLEAEELPGSE